MDQGSRGDHKEKYGHLNYVEKGITFFCTVLSSEKVY